MFSSSVEVVLSIAYREAVSRRHAYLTLEHLLFALAHDPDGERILAACGADLSKLRADLGPTLRRRSKNQARDDKNPSNRGVPIACCRRRCCLRRATVGGQPRHSRAMCSSSQSAAGSWRSGTRGSTCSNTFRARLSKAARGDSTTTTRTMDWRGNLAHPNRSTAKVAYRRVLGRYC